MNLQHSWKIVPLCLLLLTVSWPLHAQRTITGDFGLDEDADSSAAGRSLTIQSSDGRIEDLVITAVSSWDPEQASHKLVQKYQQSNDPLEREKLQVALKESVSKQFELLQKAREKELAELKKELDRLQTLHVRRENEKDRIVGDRVESLLREADGLGWGNTRFRSSRRVTNATSSLPVATPFEPIQPAAIPTLPPAATREAPIK